jgi:hypothetical protein
LQDVEDEMDLRKTLKWEKFKKIVKHKKLFEMEKLAEKWLEREKCDIKQRIERKRQQTIKKLEKHQRLIQEVKQLQERNARDAMFLPLLEEAIEKNKVLRTINYKDHINRVLESRLNIYLRKLIKGNREDKRRLRLMIKEANYNKTEIEKEQTEFQEIMGLYGEDGYSQQGTNAITIMETIFKT